MLWHANGVSKIGKIGSAATRFSLKGETVVVYGSVDEVRERLEATTKARAEWFQPVWFADEPTMPDPLALRITDVLMLASADVPIAESR
jgi:hypothetical protein